MRFHLSVLLLALAGLAPKTWGARILGIFPTASISHQMPYQAVMKALAARGHQVTVISTDPLKKSVPNYTDIDISFSYKDFRSLTFAQMSDIDTITMMENISPFIINLMEKQISSQPVQDFLRYNASQGYDLVLLEWFSYDVFFGIYHAVGSPPLVGIASTGGSLMHYDATGNPHNPGINPDPFSERTDHMTFWERLKSTYDYLRMLKLMKWTMYPTIESIYHKHFPGFPSVEKTRYNASLMVLCNHWSTEYPRALLPNVVQLTGLHVSERPPPLPAELQAWLDGAGPAGVVYFSLGSNVMSKDLPVATREALLRAFARLPQRVLWKWEEEELPGRPGNVRVAKWLPQQSVLAHPNIRVFITQGGLQSFQEATYHAVPLIGVPFMGDQHFNVAKMVSAGIAKRLLFKDITEESMHATITDIIEDHRYKERMRRFSAVFREHKEHSLENGIWWVEYVLRHNGAHHMRSASLDLAWYQLLLLDIVAAVLAAAVIGSLALFFITRALWRLVHPTSTTSLHKKKQ